MARRGPPSVSPALLARVQAAEATKRASARVKSVRGRLTAAIERNDTRAIRQSRQALETARSGLQAVKAIAKEIRTRGDFARSELSTAIRKRDWLKAKGPARLVNSEGEKLDLGRRQVSGMGHGTVWTPKSTRGVQLDVFDKLQRLGPGAPLWRGSWHVAGPGQTPTHYVGIVYYREGGVLKQAWTPIQVTLDDAIAALADLQSDYDGEAVVLIGIVP